MTHIESLLYYTKLLTGLILVLNIALVLCIHLNIRCIKTLRGAEAEPKATFPITPVEPRRAGSILVTLILLVITLNGAVIFANQRLLAAADELTSQVSIHGQLSSADR